MHLASFHKEADVRIAIYCGRDPDELVCVLDDDVDVFSFL